MTHDSPLLPEFAMLDDVGEIQEVILAAALAGDATARAELPTLREAFAEPYRTVAAVMIEQLREGHFLDAHTLTAALRPFPLTRSLPSGAIEVITAQEIVTLLTATPVQPNQVAGYLPILRERVQELLRRETAEQVHHLTQRHAGDPARLMQELQQLPAVREPTLARTDYPSELRELIPFVADLASRQTGHDYGGLDSGFPLLNQLCNGLDTGLLVLAAPPGQGKTSLMWQIACQVAEGERKPVLFVSMEQSKRELRAKALARLANLDCRDILRGRLRMTDPVPAQKLLTAATRYAKFSQYLTVIEGDASTTLDRIEAAAIQKLREAKESRCLICVDYLQMMSLDPHELSQVSNTRDRIDRLVSGLRRMARNLDSPVLVISSENRASYKKRSLSAFKESGGIEYAADIAMVLSADTETPTEPEAPYRNLDLCIIKNRNGETGLLKFKFYGGRMEFCPGERTHLPPDEGS